MRSLDDAHRPMKSVLPSNCDWIRDFADSFDPDCNQLTTRSGCVVSETSVSTLLELASAFL